MSALLDCLIIGGGPAGLTAAIYAARFRLTVRVVDNGLSRAGEIPCTHNHAGFPDGVSGRELLERMRTQALKYGAQITTGRVESVRNGGNGFEADGPDGTIRSHAVLLATGVTNRNPPIDPGTRRAALAAGRLRYCPVCDGFEVTDQNIAVVGSGERGAREALFLRAYTTQISLVSATSAHDLSGEDRQRLAETGVRVVDGPAEDFQLEAGGLSLSTAEGRLTFDVVYPALGSDVHSGLAADLGAALTDDGSIRVDAHQRSTVPGLYAAGDVVIGLDQISHAMGEAGVAATTIRNDLAKLRPLWR